MRRPPYTPLQPLLDLEFQPESTVTIPTVHFGFLEFPVERFGSYAVTILPDPPFDKMTDGDEFAVIHAESGACFATYSDLRVARSFAQELDDCLDFADVIRRAKNGDSAEYQQMAKYLLIRKQHPALIDYDVVQDVMGKKKNDG